LLLIGAAVGVFWFQGGELPGARLWGAALLVQSLPYLAALGMGLISVLPAKGAKLSTLESPTVS